MNDDDRRDLQRGINAILWQTGRQHCIYRCSPKRQRWCGFHGRKHPCNPAECVPLRMGWSFTEPRPPKAPLAKR